MRLSLAVFLLVGACVPTTRYAYRSIEPPLRETAGCEIVERCDEAERPDDCELAALDVPPGGRLVECAHEEWQIR